MSLGDLFAQWKAAGIFTYVFPFLLIFAILFGILSKIDIFGSKEKPNKGINAIISLVVALIALQFNLVSSFFSDLFPRFGIALVVLLIILIGVGLFADFDNRVVKWIFFVVILFTVIVVISTPLSNLGFKINYNAFFEQNFGLICFVILFGVAIFLIIGGRKRKSPKVEMKPVASQS